MRNDKPSDTFSDFDKQKIAIYMEEYKSCRDEIKQSLVFKYNFYILEYGFFGALASFLYKEFYIKCPYALSPLAHAFLLAIPFLFYFISLTYLQSHIRVCQNAKYIHTIINKKIDEILPSPSRLIGWEHYLFTVRANHKLRTYVSLLTSELITHLVCPLVLLLAYLEWLYNYSYPLELLGKIQLVLIYLNIFLFLITGYCKKYTIELYQSIALQ